MCLQLKQAVKRKKSQKSRSISRDLTLGLVGTIVLVSTVAVSLSYFFAYTNAEKQLQEKTGELAASLAQTLSVPLWNYDDVTVNSIGASYSQNDMVSRLKIADSHGKVYFLSDKQQKGRYLEAEGTIDHNEVAVGSYSLAISEEYYKGISSVFLRQGLLLIAINLIALLCIIKVLLKKTLETRIHQFSNMVQKFKDNNYTFPEQFTPDQEFAGFVSIIQDMAAQISARMEELTRAHAGLELRVRERTAELAAVNEELKKEIIERKQSEQERNELASQLLQAQKMEAVGRLAGGVAHDFNNMLGVILGCTELALNEVKAADPIYHDLQEIQDAANRSADLTRQLLAFARKQTVAPRVLDLNATLDGMLKMLQRLIGEDITLTWKPGNSLWRVNIDPGQIDQVLANLCVNARDAIKGVGTVTISTRNMPVDETLCKGNPDCIPGDYVLLAVRDTGCGMDAATRHLVFEPFFTNKGVGKGTGLGLATVYGIVRQNQGFICLTSALGLGTTFDIYLPRYEDGHTGTGEQPADSAEVEDGHETILLVEDDPSLLHMTKRILERLKYRVLSAGDGRKAIQSATEYGGRIDLLLTDVIMPGMNGRALCTRLMERFPEMKSLFMSGYTADVIAHHGILDEGIHFIQKPFTRKELALALRKALDE